MGRSKPLAACGVRAHSPVMASTSGRWRQRAERAWVTSERVPGPRAKVAMMRLAMTYEMLGVRAAQREIAEKLARDEER